MAGLDRAGLMPTSQPVSLQPGGIVNNIDEELLLAFGEKLQYEAKRHDEIEKMLIAWGQNRTVTPPSGGFSFGAPCALGFAIKRRERQLRGLNDYIETGTIDRYPPDVFDRINAVYKMMKQPEKQIMEARYLHGIPIKWICERLNLVPEIILGYLLEISETVDKALKRMGA